ncbi:Ac45/VOA1 transmembrane domain-containing protein [Aspergillus chevalieri]|uniref:Protein BIG1 n=1 Tax=Aspergillus chevalieri TaxID=182096 RepID=A0A7R7ZNK2_ASPCH|nr:uncharacterized protein ACHE_40200A [Aspergillus chevalieri]BCR87636.1 hypothetical protein ACHE_40200A [Aspergillus chevalieri]
MHLNGLGLLALGAATASAFRDTSPFFLASTSEILLPSSNIALSTSLLNDIGSHLNSCPSDYYVVAYQPGVHSTDFATRKSAPRLGAKMTGKDETIRSTSSIHEVSGVVDAKEVQNMIGNACGAETTVIDASTGSYPSSFGDAPRVIAVDFPMLSLGSDRAQQLSDNDGFLSDIIDRIPSSKKYTLLYVTSPRETEGTIYKPNEEAYQEPLRMELKRDYSDYTKQDSNKSLFQEYQYFTPGMFMGFFAAFVCIMILYVGIQALLSLEVPYAAFEKDTFSAVQKKQQ